MFWIEDYKKLTLEELANGSTKWDTAGWAEPKDVENGHRWSKRLLKKFAYGWWKCSVAGLKHDDRFLCVYLKSEIVLDPRVENVLPW